MQKVPPKYWYLLTNIHGNIPEDLTMYTSLHNKSSHNVYSVQHHCGLQSEYSATYLKKQLFPALTHLISSLITVNKIFLCEQ